MEGNGPWGGYGANPRPNHWADYWAGSGSLQSGNFPYSEGIYEDINKFLMLQLNWSPDRDVDSILAEYGAGWLGPDVAQDFVAVCHLMEDDEGTRFGGVTETAEQAGGSRCFQNATGFPKAEECEGLVVRMDNQLPDAVRGSWRWRLFRLRSLIDLELKRSGLRFTPALDDAFGELAEIYHADPQRTRGCVLPPRRRWHTAYVEAAKTRKGS
jgi:hypothetical protein